MAQPTKYDSLIGYFDGTLADDKTRLVDGMDYYNNVKVKGVHSDFNSEVTTESATDISSVEYSSLNRGTAWKIGFDSGNSGSGKRYGWFEFFDGTSETFSQDLSGGFTFSYYVEQDGEGHFIIGNWYHGSGAWFPAPYQSMGSDNRGNVHINMGGSNPTFNDKIYTTMWNHILINWDGSTLKLFVNGNEIGTWSKTWSSLDFDVDRWKIGYQPDTGDSFCGRLASMLIFNEALTPSEAHAIHNYVHTSWKTYTISESTNSINENNVITVNISSEKDMLSGNTITLRGLVNTSLEDNANLSISYGTTALNSSEEGSWTKSTGTLQIVLDNNITAETDISFNFTIVNGSSTLLNQIGVNPTIEIDGDNEISPLSSNTSILNFVDPNYTGPAFGHVQKLRISTNTDVSYYADTPMPLYLEFSIDHGTSWLPITSASPSITKHDGTTVSSTDYNHTRDSIIHRQSNKSEYKTYHAINGSTDQGHVFREKLLEWGLPYTNTANGSASIDLTDEEYIMYMMNTPILTWKQPKNDTYYDILGIPSNATHIRMLDDKNYMDISLEFNGVDFGSWSANDFEYKDFSLSNVTLNGNTYTPVLEMKSAWKLRSVHDGTQYGSEETLGGSAAISANYALSGILSYDKPIGITTGAGALYKKDASGNWSYLKTLEGSLDNYAEWTGSQVSITDEYALMAGQTEHYPDITRFYLYKNNDDAWDEIKIFTPSTHEYGMIKMATPLVYGDYVFFGDWIDDTSGNNAGCVYIFKKDEGGTDNWGQLKKIIPDDSSAGDRFGMTMDAYDDYLIVSAFSQTNDKGTDAGAVYIFKKDLGGTDNWGQFKKLLPSESQDYGHFGAYNIKITDLYIAVAASNTDNGVDKTSTAYIFKKNEGGADNWGEIKKLRIANANKLNQSHYDGWTYPEARSSNTFKMGLSLSMNNKYLVMAACLDLNYAGSVNIYANDNDHWSLVKTLTSHLPVVDDVFGNEIDINNDGDLIVAEMQGLSREGRVYFYNNTADRNYWVTNTMTQTTNDINVDNDFYVTMKSFKDIFSGDTIKLKGLIGTKTEDNASFDIVYNGRALNSTAKGVWTQSTGTLEIVLDSDICGNTDLSFNFTVKNGEIGRYNGVYASIEVDGKNAISATSFSTPILKFDPPIPEDPPETVTPTIINIFSNDGAFCALKSDGSVQCWGHNDFGATPPSDISNVKDIFCSSKTFSALTSDNMLITWGDNNDGSGNIIENVNLVKRLQSKRLYGSSLISTVKNNNLDTINNYKFNTNTVEINRTQVLSDIDYNVQNILSERVLSEINNITSLTDGEVKDDSITTVSVYKDKDRHTLLDSIFNNITDISFNINTEKIGLKNIFTKEKTKVLKTDQTMNLTDSGKDLSANQAVYGNLSDLSHNITVNMENNVSFKVTRTTDNNSKGKYIVEVLSGKMVVLGRHYGTIESGTANLKLGEYEDGDEVYINRDKFFFGGFGCNNLNITKKSDNLFLCIVETYHAIAVLFKDGSVKCFGGKTDADGAKYDTTGKNLDSGVIKIVGDYRNFYALKDDGSVIVWGTYDVTTNKKLLMNYHNNDTSSSTRTASLEFDQSALLESDCIDLYCLTRNGNTSGTIIVKKRDGSLVFIGNHVTGGYWSGYQFYLNESLSYYSPDGTIYNGGQGNLKLEFNGEKLYGISEISQGEVYTSNKVAAINYKGEIITWGGRGDNTNYAAGTYGGNITHWQYGIEGKIRDELTNTEQNNQQDLSYNTLKPAIKVVYSHYYAVAIFNDGSIGLWGRNHNAWDSHSDNTMDLSHNKTINLWSKLKTKKIVDAFPSYTGIALLDTSGGVYILGSYNDITFSEDISQNVIKVLPNRNNGFAFLRSDNVAIIWRGNMWQKEPYILEKFNSLITTKGTSTYIHYIVKDIADVFLYNQHGFFLKTINGEGFNIASSEPYYIMDIGVPVGGKINGVKRVYTNGCATCILRNDNTLVQFHGHIGSLSRTSNEDYSVRDVYAMAGADYNHTIFGINGTRNGGNGNGGCVFNGDGSETLLRNVLQVIPLQSLFSPFKDQYYGGRWHGQSGFLAIIANEDDTQSMVLWGNTAFSTTYIDTFARYYTSDVTPSQLYSFNTLRSNFTNKQFTDKILSIRNSDQASWDHVTSYYQYKFTYPDKFKYDFDATTIKLTVENGKFVFNNDTNPYTFEMGKTYIFDTSDSSNINNRLKVSTSLNTYDSKSTVQYLTPGEKYSFIRYTKMSENAYFYCDISGLSVGSHYNSQTNPAKIENLSTVYGGDTEKNIIYTYTSLPRKNIIPDASFNNISLDTVGKRKAVLDALFTVQPENHFVSKKDIFGYPYDSIGISSPLLYAKNMRIINSKSLKTGIMISGETTWTGAVDIGNIAYDECVLIHMNDLNDNVSLSLGGNGYGYATSTKFDEIDGLTNDIEFVLKRTTDSNSQARYEITFTSVFNTVYSNATNFNSTNNTGYFVENDVIHIDDHEITFINAGIVTKGSRLNFTVIKTTVNSNNKFVFNGITNTPPPLEYDKIYKFDVSDSSNTGYILQFSSSNSTTAYNTNVFGTPGTVGAYVTFTPGSYEQAYVFCSNNGINIGSLYNPMLLNNGISKTELENIEADTIDNNITLPTGFYDSLTGVDNLAKEGQKRRRRHQFLRTIFATNQESTTLETSKTNLGFESSYKKNTYKVFNPKTSDGKVTINMNSDSELDNTTGFYSPLEDGNYALITNTDGDVTLKVTRTESDSLGNGIYYVENNEKNGELFITETNSLTYKNGSNPAGPFKDGDTVTINFIELVFGGIGDGSSTNSSEKPGLTTFTPTFENFSMIPIFGTPNRNGFFGIADDGKLYSWGMETTGDLAPGDPDTDTTRKDYDRINDISFCVISNQSSYYHLLYLTSEGRPRSHKLVNGNSSDSYRINGVTRTRTDGWNYWFNGDVSSNDFTDLSGIVGIYPNRSENYWGDDRQCAVLLRDNGTIAYWCKNAPPYMHTTTTADFHKPGVNSSNSYNNYTFYGPAAECLFNENHPNFSKIIKISLIYGSYLFLREDGKIALVRCNKSHAAQHDLYWHGPSNSDDIDTCTLTNTLTDDGSQGNPMKKFGNVVDIGSKGTYHLNGALWFFNDRGQAFMFHHSAASRIWGIHRNLSYEMNSGYFKKTVKILTWQQYHLQIFEDGTTAIPYRMYYGENNQQLDTTNPRHLRSGRPAFKDVFDGTENGNNGDYKLYYANSKSPRIKKYYGPLILLQDDTVVPGATLKAISYGQMPNRYANWNDPVYGIYGTGNGYPADTEPYGELTNVKSLHWGGWDAYTWAALLNDNTVLTWGATGTEYFSNSYDVSNQLVNVKKIITSNHAAAALKYDGSVVVWGKSTEGGSFDANTAGSTSTMSNNTLNSGVLDVFATEEGFTAVKSDGIILWGKYKNYYDDTDNLSWSTNTNYIMRADSLNSINQCQYSHSSNFNDMNHIIHFPKYSSSPEQDTIATNLLSAGVSQKDVDRMMSYPKYLSKIDHFYIPPTAFSSGDKDDIRNLIIDLIFSMNKKKDKFEHEVSKLSLDTKIKKNNLTIFKPNLGYIDLTDYKYHYKAFYVKLEENDNINFKAIDQDLIFRITKGVSDYTITKLSGTVDLSLNKIGPYSEGSSLDVNGKKIKFVNGVADGGEIPEQKFNCIECSLGAAAYLDKSIGRVITWGATSQGGFSHDDFHGTGRDTVTAYNNPGASLSSGVVSIAVSMQAFAALKDDGSVVVWGLASQGGTLFHSSYVGNGVAENLTSGVKSVHGCCYGLGALKENGEFYCWGYSSRVGTGARYTYPSGQFPVKNVAKVYPSYHGFMLVKKDGSLSGIGGSSMGHQPSYLSNSNTYETNNFTQGQFTDDDALQNVEKLYTSVSHHVAILNDACGNQIKIIGNTSGARFFANDFKTRRWKYAVVGHHNYFAAVDISGGVVAWGAGAIVNGSTDNPTSGYWVDVSGDVSANVVRVVANRYAWMCLRSDNVLVSIRSGVSGTGDKCGDFEYTHSYYETPPSQYVISKYKMRNIKDIFASDAGFGAIDISDNVLCWGYSHSKWVNEVPHGYPNKIYGGDLSGNDISKNRPVALFSNGYNWCCLKEDETIVTWDRYNGNDSDHGSNHLHSSYGVNSTRWGGNGATIDGDDGGVRNGDGTIKVTRNVKNVVPFNTYYDKRGYIAIQQDASGNQSCVGWGGYSGPRETSTTPDSDERSFRHVVDYLTSHSPYQFGLDINGMTIDYRWPWLRSNRANLHEYDEGSHGFSGEPTGFGEVVSLIEVYDVGDIEADASNSGVDISAIEQLKENKMSEDVDETSESMPTENSVLSGALKTEGKTPKEIRKQRTNILKLAFANNPTRTKFKIDSDTLGFASTTTKRKKSSYVVYKVSFGKVTIDLKEDKALNEFTGFFVAMEPGNEATIKNEIGDFKIVQAEEGFEDGDDKFFVEGVNGSLSRIINYDSTTYDDKSNPQGPFKEGDSATINGVHIDFGSISEGTGNYSFGDPYIKPIFGGISKLPDEKAYYRLFEGKDLFINCYVNRISPEKQEYMEKWFYNKTGYDSKLFGFVTSGFFYNEIFISSENKTMFLDFEKAIIDMDSEDSDYFKIENNYEREKDNTYILNAKCNKYSISWPHETYKNIKFIVKIYENPQIDNAISIEVESNIANCKGLLVRNYKPNLMKIKDIKTLKCKKLNRRLKRAKNKFATKKIKKKNEVWVKM